jgi:hypothetical protein
VVDVEAKASLVKSLVNDGKQSTRRAKGDNVDEQAVICRQVDTVGWSEHIALNLAVYRSFAEDRE